MNIFYNDLMKLKNENRKRLEMIKNPNQRTIRDIMVYMRYSGICPFELAVVQKDLLGMAEEAAKDGVTVEEKLGVPLKEFCDSVIRDARRQTLWERFSHVMIFLFPTILLFFGYVFVLEGRKAQEGVPLIHFLIILFAAAVSFIYVVLRAKITFCQNRFINFTVLFIPTLLVIGGYLMPLGILRDSGSIRNLAAVVVPVSFQTAFGVLIFLYLLLLLQESVHWNRISGKYDWR